MACVQRPWGFTLTPPNSQLNEVISEEFLHAFQSLSLQDHPPYEFRAATAIPKVRQHLPPIAPVPGLPRNGLPSPPPSPMLVESPAGPSRDSRFPRFPKDEHPKCRRCGWIPIHRSTAGYNDPNNDPNGNNGRPYFICVKCKEKAEAEAGVQRNPNSPQKSKYKMSRTGGSITRPDSKWWISWWDDIGIDEDNRLCFCSPGLLCRQDRNGKDSRAPGYGFWTCAKGQCDFFTYRKDARTDEEARDQEADSEGQYFFTPKLLKPWSFD